MSSYSIPSKLLYLSTTYDKKNLLDSTYHSYRQEWKKNLVFTNFFSSESIRWVGDEHSRHRIFDLWRLQNKLRRLAYFYRRWATRGRVGLIYCGDPELYSLAFFYASKLNFQRCFGWYDALWQNYTLISNFIYKKNLGMRFDIVPGKGPEILILLDTANTMLANRFLRETRYENPWIINFTSPLELQMPTSIEIFTSKCYSNLYYYMELFILLMGQPLTQNTTVVKRRRAVLKIKKLVKKKKIIKKRAKAKYKTKKFK